ncbi:MAG: NUDIX hydrolase [Pseudomonadota bacterium]
MRQKNIIDQIRTLITNITPFDALEQEHINDTLAWIESGAPLFRIKKPDVPNKHLVSYFVVFDENASKILLVDHKNAMKWLPSGGHVDIDEHPIDAARRECMEELNLEADFWREAPLFLTSTFTTGQMTHHFDVSLWYVVKGDHRVIYEYDTREFHGIKWFGFDEIPYDNADPHMGRFINKLKGMLCI